MRIRFGRPPATVGVARNPCGIEQCRSAIRERVVGTAVMPEGAWILLRGAIESRGVRVANLLPNPPAIVGPDFENITVAIAEENQLRGRLHVRPTTQIVFVSGGPPERRRRTAGEPVDVDRAEAAEQFDLAV